MKTVLAKIFIRPRYFLITLDWKLKEPYSIGSMTIALDSPNGEYPSERELQKTVLELSMAKDFTDNPLHVSIKILMFNEITKRDYSNWNR